MKSSLKIKEPPPMPSKALGQLLQFVVEGEQDKAEALIRENKNLLLHAGTVTDLSNREFKQITAFQYALWALDWHMWRMIQKYLPREAQAKQLQMLETQGTEHDKHFSLRGLIDTLQMYVDKFYSWDSSQRDNYWIKVVGGEQKQLPVHVVNEYCRGDRAFEPCPSEWKSKLPRTRDVLKVWDSTKLDYVEGSWYIPSSSQDGLGLTYAFLRYNSDPIGALPWGDGGHGMAADHKALQSLWKTRTRQLDWLTHYLRQGSLLNTVLKSIVLVNEIINFIHDYAAEIDESVQVLERLKPLVITSSELKKEPQTGSEWNSEKIKQWQHYRTFSILLKTSQNQPRQARALSTAVSFLNHQRETSKGLKANLH